MNLVHQNTLDRLKGDLSLLKKSSKDGNRISALSKKRPIERHAIDRIN